MIVTEFNLQKLFEMCLRLINFKKMDRFIRNIIFLCVSLLFHGVFICFLLQVEPDLPVKEIVGTDIILEENVPEFVYRKKRVGSVQKKTVPGKRVAGRRVTSGETKVKGGSGFSSGAVNSFSFTDKLPDNRLVLSENTLSLNVDLSVAETGGRGAVRIAGLKGVTDADWNPGDIREYREAGGRSGIKISRGSMKLWYGRICKKITGNWHIPPFVNGSGKQAICGVKFVIDKGGRVISSKIVKSPGIEKLNERALYAVNRGAPYPPPPITGNDIELYIEFDYNG